VRILPEKEGNIDLSKDVFQVLLYLYGVVIALALTTAIGITVSPSGVAVGPLQLNEKLLTLFGAFFVTIVPFYHGASVYLLRTYKHGNPSSKRGAPLVDFFVLAIEGVIFYAIAASIKTEKSFIVWLALLFLLDLVWIGFTYIKSSDMRPSEGEQAPKWWAILNSVMILFLISISGIDASSWTQIYYLIFAAAIIRTFFDYLNCYDYYFPLTKKTKSKIPEPPSATT
jgi:hypothetical protein